MVKQGKASLETSRRGGTVMRIVFPKGTLWDEQCEAEVLASCAALMQGMRHVLSGVV
jgi:ribosomal protein L25 (general stress protein Ctc)